MSRAARDSSDNFSTFPFLAVLLCLMGALLVLLMGLTKAGNDRARKQEAVRQASAAKDDPPPKTANQLVEIQQYTAQLETVRSTATARMREDQARLSHLEDHMRRLKDELGTLQIAAMELEAMASEHTDDRAQAQSELARINQLSDELQERIDQLQEEQRGKGKSYAIVPYEGRNGTHRPTIYVECRAGRVILQPEGVELKATDFLGPMGAGNPLAAALRAAKEFIVQQTPAGSDNLEPYPLILVRPDGIDAYWHVRRAIRGWEADFGYELVDGDWNLTYPAPNPELARREQRAIEESRARQRLLAEAAPLAYGNAGGSFGFEDDGAGDSADNYGSNDQRGDGSESGVAGAAQLAAGVGVHGGHSSGGQPGLAEIVATESTPTDNFSGPALASGGASGGDYTAGRLGGGGGPAATPTGGLDGEASLSAEDPSAGGQGSDTMLAQQRGGPANSPQAAGSSGTQGGGSTSENSQAGGAGGAPSSQMGMQSAAAGDSPVASQSASSGPGGDTSGASASLDITPKAARNRGKDWAIRDATPSNVAIRRTVQVVVRAEQIAILPDRVQTGRVVQDPVGKTLSVNAARTIPVETFVSGLWEHMEQWGIAGNGLYWKPILVLNVAPGGERRAAELTQLLRNSGVEVRASDTAQRTDQPSHATPR